MLAGHGRAHSGHDPVEEIDDVVDGERVEGGGEGDQVSPAPLDTHAAKIGGLGPQNVAGQRLDPARREPADVEAAHAETPDLLEASQPGHETGNRCLRGRPSQLVQSACSSPWRYHEQRLEVGHGRVVDRCPKLAPQAHGGPLAHLRHRSFQGGDTGQENLAVDEVEAGLVKQHHRTFTGHVGPPVQPAQKPEMVGLGVEVGVAVGGGDVGLVLESDRALAVALDHGGVGDLELTGNVFHQPPRHIDRVGEKGPEMADGEHLQPVAEPGPLRSPPGDHAPVLVAQHEPGGQLLGGQLVGEAAVGAALVGGEELDGHQQPPIRLNRGA